MRKKIAILGIIALSAIISVTFVGRQGGSAKPEPQPMKQEIYVYYSSGNAAEMMTLSCVISGGGYLCPLTGAGGGGHAFAV